MQRRESQFPPFFLSIRGKPLPAPAFPCALPGGYGSSAGGSAVFTLLLTEMKYISASNRRSVYLKQSLCSDKTELLLKRNIMSVFQLSPLS
ncbi:MULTISPECIES: hypothetical protein [Bacteroides]|uniref:hypothetical protein n=1 Tax=Bacteroides TaxID=816 RepID=UPI00031ED1F5|nr:MULTISPECIES: hypothetical protein [Bacteroides]MBV3620862.1 hypothetical protein [Bacteroides xylanisolvens]